MRGIILDRLRACGRNSPARLNQPQRREEAIRAPSAMASSFA